MAPSDVELRRQLRDAGLRATPARLAVLRMLHGREGSPSSHPEVVAALQPDGWDRATLYRNLVDLTDVGLLRRVDLGDHLWRYELVSAEVSARGPHRDEDHPHFLCTVCGDVSCLAAVSIPFAGDVPDAVKSGQVSIQLRGRCDRCTTPA